MEHWLFGLDAWVVQDGNYGDFERGQVADFAVELTPHEDRLTLVAGEPSASLRPVCWRHERPPPPPPTRQSMAFTPEPGVVYDLVARVVGRKEGVAILDCGIGMYCTYEPVASADVGLTLAVIGSLDVDPFTYFEQLAEEESSPPLIYRWRIERIGRQLAPWQEDEPGSFARDPSDLAFAPVESTDAFEDDAGHASYALECVRLAEPPRRRRERYA
jgi:hypothetical protein